MDTSRYCKRETIMIYVQADDTPQHAQSETYALDSSHGIEIGEQKSRKGTA